MIIGTELYHALLDIKKRKNMAYNSLYLMENCQLY